MRLALTADVAHTAWWWLRQIRQSQTQQGRHWPSELTRLESFFEDIRGQIPPGADIVVKFDVVSVDDGPVSYSKSEFARRVGVSSKTVSRWIAEGHIDLVRIGDSERVPAYELEKFTRRSEAAVASSSVPAANSHTTQES